MLCFAEDKSDSALKLVNPKYLWNLRFGNETFFYALTQGSPSDVYKKEEWGHTFKIEQLLKDSF